MNSQNFLNAFGHIADAPGGVARLRELILQLAITGSLTQKDEQDASVESDLASARILQSEYVDKLELRKILPHSPVTMFPFSIPSHWAWERLERLCLYIQRGKSPTYVDRSSTRVVSQKCIQWPGFDLAPARFVSDDAVQGYGPERLLRNGDLLWNSTGTGTAGRIAIFDIEQPNSAVADSHVTVMRLANFEPRYVWCVIAAPWTQTRISPDHPDSLVSGTTQQVELATSVVRALEIPCPPIAEQRRIVAKVDELMTLCDRLEKQQEVRRTLQVKTRKALAKAVANASASREVLSGWSKLADHLGDLISCPEDVSELRSIIYDFAVRGSLNVDSQSVDICSALDESLKPSPARKSRSGRRKSSKHILDIEASEIPFEIPSSWRWVRLGAIADLINGDRGKKYPKKSEYVSSGIAWINTGHIEPDGSLSTEKMNYISREKFNSLNGGKIESGDLVYCLRGATLGKVAFVTPYVEGSIASSLMIIRPLEQEFNKYLFYYLQSPLGRSQIFLYDNGTAQPNLSANSVSLFVVPLPPIDEQKRIVANLEHWMSLCAKMEDELRQARSTAASFAQAVVSSITGIAVTEEEAELKAPYTELIAPLRIGKSPKGSAQAPLASILVRHKGAMSAKDLWQRFGGEIDGFYVQLKHEVAQGWIAEPEVAEMRERESV